MSVTASLAAFVAETAPDEIPAEVRKRAVLTLADTYATTLAGTGEPAVGVFAAGLLPWAGPGRSVVVATGDRTDPMTASLVNGVTAHALDYDAISFAVSGFVGSATACALSALVEDRGVVEGADVVTAYCLGWEAAAALARGINPLHYSKGWHPTATMSLFAATLACSRLLGLDARATAMALGVAVADASGPKTMIGNMANPYHVGKAARNGIVAARLASVGFEAHPAALEASQGFLNLFQGRDGHDVAAIERTIGSTWDLSDPGPVFKIHPCCGLIHSGLDALISLKAEHHLEPDEVNSILVAVHEYVPTVMSVDQPRSGYEAKFSVPYCVAGALRDGAVTLGMFSNVDLDLVQLGERVTTSVHPELRGGETFFEHEFTEVTVATTRGVFTRRVNRLENRGTGVHAETEDLRRKFDDCLAFSERPGVTPDEAWERVTALDGRTPWHLWDLH